MDVMTQLRTSDHAPEVNGLCFQFVLYTSVLQLTVALSDITHATRYS